MLHPHSELTVHYSFKTIIIVLIQWRSVFFSFFLCSFNEWSFAFKWFVHWIKTNERLWAFSYHFSYSNRFVGRANHNQFYVVMNTLWCLAWSFSSIQMNHCMKYKSYLVTSKKEFRHLLRSHRNDETKHTISNNKTNHPLNR